MSLFTDSLIIICENLNLVRVYVGQAVVQATL